MSQSIEEQFKKIQILRYAQADKPDFRKSLNLRPLRKFPFKQHILLINQYLVEQALSPAIYSRGRLFYMVFAEVSSSKNVQDARRTPAIGWSSILSF